MKNVGEFHTVRGYQILKRKINKGLSPSMEDYLEMIYRDCLVDGFARVNTLADQLNVRASSVSRTVRKLADMNYIKYRKYGIIQLTEKGKSTGKYLLNRHKTVEKFLQFVGVEQNLLVDVELIEHHLSRDALRNLEKLVAFFQANPDVVERFKIFKANFKENKRSKED